MRRPVRILAALALLVVAAPTPALAAWREEKAEVPTRPDVTVTVYLAAPEAAPAATLMLLPGGDGKIRDWGPPDRNGTESFLVRSRRLFVEQGFATAVVDAPSDHPDGMRAFRTRPEHAADLAAIVAWLRQHDPAPVWLIGSSRGAISAALAAGSGAPIDGLVLASSLTRPAPGYPGSVYDADLASIGVPTLVVNHRSDTCPFSLAADGPALVAALTRAPRRELLLVDGGAGRRSSACDALSPHGYLGAEREATARIAAWIKG